LISVSCLSLGTAASNNISFLSGQRQPDERTSTQACHQGSLKQGGERLDICTKVLGNPRSFTQKPSKELIEVQVLRMRKARPSSRRLGSTCFLKTEGDIFRSCNSKHQDAAEVSDFAILKK